ncbi:MAG: hypothetical protein V4665_03290 [Patescibacteria group bacterium]
MEIKEKFYGFIFYDIDYINSRLCITSLPVDERTDLKDILISAEIYSQRFNFNPQFGFLKEVTLYNGKVQDISPSYSKKKPQSFIIQGRHKIIKNINSSYSYSIRGKNIKFDFSDYAVSILKKGEIIESS